MFNTEFLLGIIFVLLATSTLMGQIDTSLQIQEIQINGRSIRNDNLGGKKDVIYRGEQMASTDLTNLLNQLGGVYIKSYGANSLGTSSIRGGSAGHSLILWNGIPLQSPTLGLLDLSLIPIRHMEEVSIQRGGNSALWGSGAIGGVINLENKLETKSSIQGDLQYGSFGDFSAGIKHSYGKKRFYGKTKVSYNQSKNNFPYTIATNLPKKELVNAAFNTTNVSQDLYFVINKRQHINVHYWGQKSRKEIPPTLTQNFNESHQEDEANRLILSWNRITDAHKTHIKLAVLDEEQQYVNPIINLVSDNVFTQWIAEVGHGINYKDNQQWLFGMTFVETSAKTNGFSNKISERKMGFWLSHQWSLGNLDIQTALREEVVEGQAIPVTPSLGIEYSLNEEMKLLSKVSRNYRLATLNDKYWMPGGNSDLRPESGWSEELSFKYNKANENQQFEFELTGFNRNIKNWILWSPSAEFNFWEAQNLTEVWSRGIETSGRFMKRFNQTSLSLKINYNFIKSTNEVAISLPKLDKGQQLIYTPIHQIGSLFMLTHKAFQLSYLHQFNGKNQGINDMIPAYHLGTIYANYQTVYKNSALKFFVQFQNIWNVQYVVVERRPMPGINFQTGIKFIINKHK